MEGILVMRHVCYAWLHLLQMRNSNNSKIIVLKNLEGDIKVEPLQIQFTKHAEQRRAERSFDHVNECFEGGVSSKGPFNLIYKLQAYKNTAMVVKNGQNVQATVVYSIEKSSSSVSEKMRVVVITVYYRGHKAR